MSWWTKHVSHPVNRAIRNVSKAIRRPLHPINNAIKHARKAVVKALPSPIRRVVKKAAKVIHNPARAIVPFSIRKSSAYRNVARPIIKVGTAAIVGALTGGIGVAGGLSWSGLSVAGAVGGGITGALNHGLDSSPFQPGTQILAPAVAGFAADYAWTHRSGIINYVTAKTKAEMARNVAKLSAHPIETAIGAVGSFAGLAVNSKRGAQSAPVPALIQPTLDVTPSPIQNTQIKKTDSTLTAMLVGAGAGLAIAGPHGALIGGAIGAAQGATA